MKFYELPNQFRKIDRLGAIVATLVKYQIISATEKLDVLNPVTLFTRLSTHTERVPEKKTRARLLRKVIEDLGTTYIKFGQWLSVRPDFVPPELIEELETLQDRLPPIPFKSVRRTIEEETGKKLEQTFYKFDPEPLSTASIAQVHRAVLRGGGEEVAVKVQHPRLKRLIAADLAVLRTAIRWAVKHWPHLSYHRPEDLITSFEETLRTELDFREEAKNQERLALMLGDDDAIRIPKVYWEHTSERLLVMEYLDGFKLGQQRQFWEWRLDQKLLARRLSDYMYHQIFEVGNFHADPHPGNILFMKENQIGLVDFGIVARYSDQLRNRFLDWFYAVLYRDVDLFMETFLDVGKAHAPVDEYQFRNDSLEYIDEIYFQPVDRISFARALVITNRILYRHKISVPPTFLFFFKTISTLEGVARRLDPEFDWRDDWGPRLEQLMRERWAPSALLRRQNKLLQDYYRLIEDYPDDVREIQRRLKEGSFEIRLRGFDDYIEQTRRGYNKVALALVVSAFVLGVFILGHAQAAVNISALGGVLVGLQWVLPALLLVIFFFRRR